MRAILYATCLGLAAVLASPAVQAGATKAPGAKANRLIHEASPYLRQHAYNPVDWYPWGEEAFAKARKEGKPILVSIGYSTCHWCHVMARESYSNPAIAKILNDNFVAIKVDRERRPDVDETYMLATELITRSGGWPNNVFLTPDLKPFMAGTYFPPDRFSALLEAIATHWQADRAPFEDDSRRIAEMISQIMSARMSAARITTETLKNARAELERGFDVFYGGFGAAPKFPQEPSLLFLLGLAERHGDAGALKTVTASLDGMLNGGIQDQVGGGFHRYATDNRWRVPHFEKMLYNQALIGLALVRAYRLTGSERYARAARRTFDFVLKDMTAPGGGFYSAFDADSAGEEGSFYVWTPDQIRAALKREQAEFAIQALGLSDTGNFAGRTILHLPLPIEDLADKMGLGVGPFLDRLRPIRATLAAVRAKRKWPDRDDKILTGWNGLMIRSLAEAGATLAEPRFSAAAVKAGNFLWQSLGAGRGRLKRAYFEGHAALEATQQDHALAALAFIALYDTTGNERWIDRAKTVVAAMNQRFLDGETGDYFMTAEKSTFARAKTRNDSATPSGNAIALEVLAKLSRRERDPKYAERATKLLAALSGVALKLPGSATSTLFAADELLNGEVGPSVYLAKGVVRARLSRAPGNELTLRLAIAKGWHINSNKPLEDFFIATEFGLADPASGNLTVTYPRHVLRRLGFHDKELAVYEGEVAIRARFAPNPPSGAPFATRLPTKVRLNLQACSNEICLEPEAIDISLPPVHAAARSTL